MHHVIISLAANCNHEKNLSEARRRLAQILSSFTFTHELWTEPVGTHRSDLYLNQLCQGHTALSKSEIEQWLKATEQQMGRTSEERQQGIVRIDLDLLQYDDQRHHLRDWERPYVANLLSFLKQ